jgi:hypothetical protein
MTLTAESFLGRVVAVLSRRSPGFRPPAPRRAAAAPPPPARTAPAPVAVLPDVPVSLPATAVQGPTLAEATAEWKHAPAATRLRRRRSLHELADALGSVHRGVKEGAGDLAHTLDAAHAKARALDPVISRALDGTRAEARELGLTRELIRQLERAEAREPDLSHSPDVDLDLVHELTRARELSRTHARIRALARELTRARHLARELTRTLADDLREAAANLASAADDFLGADLTGVDLTRLDVAGVRWDTATRWPSPEWGDRVRRASVEHPPGSGVFVVLPEDDHDPADMHLV